MVFASTKNQGESTLPGLTNSEYLPSGYKVECLKSSAIFLPEVTLLQLP